MTAIGVQATCLVVDLCLLSGMNDYDLYERIEGAILT
jgi:hypothetical protein